MMDIRSYFDSYADAYLAFDPDALIPFFHLPCLVHDQGGVHAIDSIEALRRYEQPMLDLLHSKGATVIETEVHLVKPSESTLESVQCTVGYVIRDAEGQILLDFDYDYVLLQQEQSWRILFAQVGAVRS